MTQEQVLQRVKGINASLRANGYDPADIERFWDDCIREAKANFRDSDLDMFRSSTRAKKLAQLVKREFNITLVPALKRRYTDNDSIKFEMMDADKNRYYFHGLVIDFLEPSAVIEKRENHFKLLFF